MCQIKRRTVYMCPICKKIYKNKGYYLNKHLKQCKAIAWIPKVEVRIVMMQIEEDNFALAIDKLINGKVGFSNYQVINRTKKEKSPEDLKDITSRFAEPLPSFQEYKEKLNNGGIKLIEVPQEELHHIYNIMVATT